jgi:hypothetical protein
MLHLVLFVVGAVAIMVTERANRANFSVAGRLRAPVK